MTTTNDILYQEIKSIRDELNDLKTIVLEMQSNRVFMSSVYRWVGGIILALLSTDAVLDLIVNHWPHIH